MFNVETYISPILLSYVDKYVRDFKPEDVQVSLWAGGVTLHNLVLKADVLQQEVSLPFTLVSGRIHELIIHVPWTKLTSEPIVVTINTIECVLSLNPPPDENPTPEQPRTKVVEAPPGYMQALVRRVVSNIVVRINSLIVKYVHDDIVLSLNVKKLTIDSVGPNWEPQYAEIDPNCPAIRRLIRLDDLTLCLDKTDCDGKIRYFQEPLLYRCQLDLRVLTKLVSATKRRATSLSIQLISKKLAWGVTDEQLALLVRLLQEARPPEAKFSQQTPKQNNAHASQPHASSSSAEPDVPRTWSEWAWSWLPVWDREDVETESPAPPTPVQINFTAFFEAVSIVLKIMEHEANGRKRPRGIMQLVAADAVLKTYICYPSTFRVQFGTRVITLQSLGKCSCGHISMNTRNDEPTVYLGTLQTENAQDNWCWVHEDMEDKPIETAISAEENSGASQEATPKSTPEPDSDYDDDDDDDDDDDEEAFDIDQNHIDDFWVKMSPVVYINYRHDRTPSNLVDNPYENLPRDYQYSDWKENSVLSISVKPINIEVTMGLIHRLQVIQTAIKSALPPYVEPPVRVLTLEECEALSENLPRRGIVLDLTGITMRVYPWDHSLTEKSVKAPLAFDMELPKATVLIKGPLYPYRVASAASQMLDDYGPLWEGSKMHMMANISALQFGIGSTSDNSIRTCARFDFRLVTHHLQYRQLFKQKESVMLNGRLKLHEINVCGSMARLQAAVEVILSLWNREPSPALKYTSLAKDVLHDEESVTIDITLEKLDIRGFNTNNTTTAICAMHGARATLLHTKDGKIDQSWIFSAPNIPVNAPYLRVACQWCKVPTAQTLEYLGVWVEPTAFSIDPMLIAWLSYEPKMKRGTDSIQKIQTAKASSSAQYLLRKKSTPPSSSGRGGSRSGSGAELVHIRPPSVESSSEKSEKRDTVLPPPAIPKTSWWDGDFLSSLHHRLNRLTISVDVGLLSLYITEKTVTALETPTLREAMEKHAENKERVLVMGLGNVAMNSSAQLKELWARLKFDGPTYAKSHQDANAEPKDSFPWRMCLGDMSCYTLELRNAPHSSTLGKAPRSQLKQTARVAPKTVLESVSTTITLSIDSKTVKTHRSPKRVILPKKPDAKETNDDERIKFFSSGTDFKPTTVKEFVRGPERRDKSNHDPEPPDNPPDPEPSPPERPVSPEPMISLGMNIHADTPPVIGRLDPDQIKTVSAGVHCLTHFVTLLKRTPITEPEPKQNQATTYVKLTPSKPFTSTVVEAEKQSQSEDTATENASEQLISIYEAKPVSPPRPKLQAFLWFQWVICRATLIVTAERVRLAFELDDIISSLDVQEHYKQLKVKVASGAIRHHTRRKPGEVWITGALGGRVLDTREPANPTDESHFLSVTVTKAQIANLPPTWREDVQEKTLEEEGIQYMREMYIKLAPLEVILQSKVIEEITSCLHGFAPKTGCLLKPTAVRPSPTNPWQWPYLFMSSGGFRVLMISDGPKAPGSDDTLIIVVDKISLNPHPENPICRKPVNSSPPTESSWTSSSHPLEGRQYEVLIKSLAIRTSRFNQLVYHETITSEMAKSTSGENPALKWSQKVISPTITPILHAVDVSCVIAPAVFGCDSTVLGLGVEVNFISDCIIEISFEKIELVHRIIMSTMTASEPLVNIHAVDGNPCAYANLVTSPQYVETASVDGGSTLFEETAGMDSGMETAPSTSTLRTAKKSISTESTDRTVKATDYMDVFVTMGGIDLSLYVAGDGTEELMFIPSLDEDEDKKTEEVAPGPAHAEDEPLIKVVIEEKRDKKSERDKKSDKIDDGASTTKSLTETVRQADIGKTTLNVPLPPSPRRVVGHVPLLHLTLRQPNLYYSKKKTQKSVQMSLFDAWVALGGGEGDEAWNLPLITTAKGTPDIVTDIPPALATLRMELTPRSAVGSGVKNARGAITFDIERPILIEVSAERLKRLKDVEVLIKENFESEPAPNTVAMPKLSGFYSLRNTFIKNCVESITINTSQIGVMGREGVVAWDSLSLQVAAGSRPDCVVGTGLMTALMVTAGPSTDKRHVILQPLMIGGQLQARWDSWRRAEGCPGSFDPDISIGLDLDQVILDMRPEDLGIVHRVNTTIREIFSDDENAPEVSEGTGPVKTYLEPFLLKHDTNVSNDQYYKDDLRSGAFQIVTGTQPLPMAYQVLLRGCSVSWKYPHPRAITRVIVFPVPGQVEDVECALELYCPILLRWETYSYFRLPVTDPYEMNFHQTQEDAVFALTWRVRACQNSIEGIKPFVFDAKKFKPNTEPLATVPQTPVDCYKKCCNVSAEKLSAVLRIDSFFASRLVSRLRLATRIASLEFHAYNSVPKLTREALTLEGYYVSRPLMRSHRVLSVTMRDTAAHMLLGASSKLVIESKVTSDVLDTATGTMEPLVEEFRAMGVLKFADDLHFRMRADDVKVFLHVPRICTLRSLADDWNKAYNKYIKAAPEECDFAVDTNKVETMTASLNGRVSLWIHNTCTVALRIGQDATEEVVPLGSGTSLAYRWRLPRGIKRLRFALATPALDWRWSTSITFSGGTCRVRLEDGTMNEWGGMYLYVNVKETGVRWDMYLSGRLVIANMMRFHLYYKMRARVADDTSWPSISNGELAPETVGKSVLCNSESEVVFKLKISAPSCGWSGDIPFKECRKLNVPWLVKVPTNNGESFTSIWCRVIRARSDGRIVACVWPFYVLRSHLPLDIDVTIKTLYGVPESESSTSNDKSSEMVLSAAGRGAITHLIVPGTTSAHHMITLRYKNIDCPVEIDAIPLHYGVTEKSVFEKPENTLHIEDIIVQIRKWFRHSSEGARSEWPYSIVRNHWASEWYPSLIQPRSDITIRYKGVCVGGGCSLEMHVCPDVLIANASLIPLTLRAHDAAPLCKLGCGVAASLPATVLKRPFFMSVEAGRETFVSGQLQVCLQNPGVYGSPPPGFLAAERACNFAIHCNQKVALLTMFYEIKHNINVFGITSTFMLINQLDTDLMISAMAVPNEMEASSTLGPKSFKIIPPTDRDSIQGTPLCRFWMHGRWRGVKAEELRVFLCLTLPSDTHPTTAPIPIRLGLPPARRAVALYDYDKPSTPVVVTQLYHEGRWVITVAEDPCPQFFVHNRTSAPLAIAQPLQNNNEESGGSKVKVVQECANANWWCIIGPSQSTHYSTPAYCARFPPTDSQPPSIPFITVGSIAEEKMEPKWCQPIAVTDGEQLLQMYGNTTVKVYIRTYPHSSYIELQDVDQNDISASDIRRRLVGPFALMDSISNATSTSKSIGAHDQEDSSGQLETATGTGQSEPVVVTSTQQLGVMPSTSQIEDTSDIDVTSSKKRSEEKIVMRVDLGEMGESSLMKLSGMVREDIAVAMNDAARRDSEKVLEMSESSYELETKPEKEWSYIRASRESERLRCVVSGLAVVMSASPDTLPLLSLQLDRTALVVTCDDKKIKTTLSVLDVQLENSQYETGQFDFAVVATTRAERLTPDPWPALWGDCREALASRSEDARFLLNTCYDKWTVTTINYGELTEVEARVGPLSLYIEKEYISALVELFRLAVPSMTMTSEQTALAECASLQCPLRLRKFHLHPLDLTLTLHTAMRMYIALDQSPLRLSAFQLQDVMTSSERLSHALTVHYLSAAILGAGWVVGGLELLGAPGALAARVGGASGGLKGVAFTTAVAMLKSLSACAGSLARNLDLLAGDEEHAKRAAAARRRPPPSLMAGLMAGITNFAINILGAVGGLAHHPLVGVAVGETNSSAAALRRGLVGAIAKPLSATADLFAYAGQGLLTQTGWDPEPQPRFTMVSHGDIATGWKRDCVRWSYRLAELTTIAGFEALLSGVRLQLLITHKFLVLTDAQTERVLEMIDFKICTLAPFEGDVVELRVFQKHMHIIPVINTAEDEENEVEISAAAMARVARYTGLDGPQVAETLTRVLKFEPAEGTAHALYALLTTAIHHNSASHFPLM